MKQLKPFFICALCFLHYFLFGQEDVKVLEGGIEMGGIIEATINNDVNSQGVRNNPDRIYELKRGQFYLMHGKLEVDNPGGLLTIRAEEGDGPLPVVLLNPLNEIDVGTHEIIGSLRLQGIQYHAMQTDGRLPLWFNWIIYGDSSKLIVEDCMFEHCNGGLFSTSDVGEGLCIQFRNNYFRDFHGSNQWWGGRVVVCVTPVDTLIFENNTCTGAGLTILSQESLIDYAVINHNTIINNVKYPFLNQYWKTAFLTNNLFVNANWVGEDLENIATGALDPDALLHGLVGVDTITSSLENIQARYLKGNGELTEEVDEISDYIWYAADNVCVASSTLDSYYNGEYNEVFNAPVSYLNWSGLEGPHRVRNVPGIFMNERTMDIIAGHYNIKAENNQVYLMTAEDLGFGTDPLPQDAADVYVQWNRNQWCVPNIAGPLDLYPTYFGDYDPTTVPGVEMEASTGGGIRKISDLPEDFSYSADLVSQTDGLPIGALHWDNIEFDSDASLEAIKRAYYDNSTDITFRVDMQYINDLALDGTVWLNLGSGEDRYPMSGPEGDGIFTVMVELPANTEAEYFYSYQNGPDALINVVEEAVPADCAGDGGLRSFTVPFNDLRLPAVLFDSCSAGFYPVTDIDVSSKGGVTQVYVDSTLQMEARIQPSEASDTSVYWQVDDPSIAHIDPQSGLLTALDYGWIIVSATANDGSGVRGETGIEVILLVQNMEINGNEDAVISIGEKKTLHLDLGPDNANDCRVQWSSGNPEIVQVDSLGLITGVSSGVSTITASAMDGSGVSASIEVRVMSNDASLSSLEADAGVFTPPFNPETYIYVLELPAGSTAVTISATANHEKATISGTGVVEMASGNGSAVVVVVAEDKSELEYIIAIKVNTTGISLKLSSDLGVFPNPASNRLCLEGRLKADLSIYNSLGQLLLSGQDVNYLDVSDLAPGIYILKVDNGEHIISGSIVIE